MRPQFDSREKQIRMPRLGQSAIFFCAVLWSTSGLFIKLLNWHPIVIAGSRSVVAALFLLGVRLLFPSIRRGKSNLKYMIAGALAYAATMLTFVSANKLTSSANAILLQYTAPVWAAVLGALILKEKPHWEHWTALLMVMGGLILFFKDSLGQGHAAGDCLALASGFFFALHSVCLRLQREENPQDSLLFAHVISASFALPFFFFFPPVVSLPAAGAVVFMGTIQIGLASFLFAYGIKRVTAIQAMLTAMIEPILNPVWVLLITGESPAVSAILGGGIIIAAVVFSSIIGRRRASLTGSA
ncbi:MAG: DMT family transporter [Treponema sp.]|jgi:drug/metabolite transporter (DMT)-like permease|nr:DMT family transporter [Treponema sp.]